MRGFLASEEEGFWDCVTLRLKASHLPNSDCPDQELAYALVHTPKRSQEFGRFVLESVLHSGIRVWECALTFFPTQREVFSSLGPTIKIVGALEFSHWNPFNNYPRLCLLTIYANDSGFLEQN